MIFAFTICSLYWSSQRSLKHFTAAFRGFPPCTQSQHPINRETGYSNVLTLHQIYGLLSRSQFLGLILYFYTYLKTHMHRFGLWGVVFARNRWLSLVPRLFSQRGGDLFPKWAAPPPARLLQRMHPHNVFENCQLCRKWFKLWERWPWNSILH